MSQPHLDEKVVWKGLEKLRKDSIKSESSYKCISLIEAKDIDHNFINLSKYLNVSTASDEIKNLSKLVIENGSKKFHYLNGYIYICKSTFVHMAIMTSCFEIIENMIEK